MNYTIEQYLEILFGSPFIKDKKIADYFVEVTYFNTYEEFKTHKPDTLIDKNMFDNYFETGDKIVKLLITEPIRILRQFPNIDRVGFNIRDYHFMVDRNILNNFLGLKIEELSISDGSWVEFVNSFTYNKDQRPVLFSVIQNFSNQVIQLSKKNNVSISEQLKWIHDSLKTEKILMNIDGSFKYVDDALTIQQHTQNSLLLVFITGMITQLGSKTTDIIFNSEALENVKEFAEILLNTFE